MIHRPSFRRLLGALGACVLGAGPVACGPASASGPGAGPLESPNPQAEAGSPNPQPGGESPDAGPTLSLADYCTQSAQIGSGWCTYLSACCGAADQADLLYAPPACALGPTDPNECIDLLTMLIADGSVVYHGENAQACVDEVAKWVPPAPWPATCTGVHLSDHVLSGHAQPALVQIPACRQTRAGQLTSGAACSYDFQCVDGLRCRSYLGSTTDFRCQSTSMAGEPCSLQSDCADGLKCIGDTGAATCDTLHGVGQNCIFTSDCEDGLLCGNDVCLTPPPLGAACDASNGYTCAPLDGCSFTTSLCVPLGADGSSCSLAGECQGRCDTTTDTCVSICGGTW
jgi:hypothetical protein